MRGSLDIACAPVGILGRLDEDNYLSLLNYYFKG